MLPQILNQLGPENFLKVSKAALGKAAADGANAAGDASGAPAATNEDDEVPTLVGNFDDKAQAEWATGGDSSEWRWEAEAASWWRSAAQRCNVALLLADSPLEFRVPIDACSPMTRCEIVSDCGLNARTFTDSAAQRCQIATSLGGQLAEKLLWDFDLAMLKAVCWCERCALLVELLVWQVCTGGAGEHCFAVASAGGLASFLDCRLRRVPCRFIALAAACLLYLASMHLSAGPTTY